MSGTFRAVVRPNKVLITTDMAGVLSFAGRATSFIFNSGQSEAFSSVSNTEHLIDSQLIEIFNQGSSDILIAGSLMIGGLPIDIEPGMVQILLWSASTGKFVDVGGTAATKNLEVNVINTKSNFHAHTHNGTGSAKVKATDLDPVTGKAGDFLYLDALGKPVWTDPFTGTSEQIIQIRNTDISTNLNNPSSTTIPINGSIDKNNSIHFQQSGNGIKVVNYNGWIKVKTRLCLSFASTSITMRLQVAKNGTIQPGWSDMTYLGSLDIELGMNVVSNDVITLVLTRLGATGNVLFDGTNSTMTCEIPSSALARGPEGTPGTPGWSWRSGFGAPSNSLGVNQDVYLDKTNMDLYEKIAGLWTHQLNIKGQKGELGPSRMMIWAERDGNLNNNAGQWGFGAGSTTEGRGIVMMSSGRVTKMSYQAVSAGNGVKTIEIMKNDISTGQSITIAENVGTGFVTFITPVPFEAGDLIGFRTVLAGGASRARVAAEIELD